MTARQIKETLARGGRVFGTFFTCVTNPAIVDLLPEEGLDFVVANTEHNALALADLLPLQYALRARGIACLVRIHTRDLQDVRKACDSFPDGVVVPYVEDVEEMKRLAGAAKYRPLAGAAFDRLMATGEWPSDATREYVHAKCADTLFCPMIESVDALGNLDALCGVEGVDVVFVGPNDMTTSLGIPEQRDDPAFIDAVQQVIDAAERNGIAAGGHFADVRHAQRMIEQGARFIPFSTDARCLQAGLASSLQALRGESVDGPELIV